MLKLLLATIGLTLLAGMVGCAGTAQYTDYNKDVADRSETMRKGPEAAPRPSETGFNQALRCMDLLFMSYGIKDVTALVEDIPDPTKKVNAGGKDMLISAVSQMSRRSRAIRLVAYSATDYTLKEVIERTAQRLENLPQYTLRGSISQYDESVVKKQGDAGIVIGPFSAGKAKQGTASILGLDLNVIDTATLTLEPGVTSRNSVLVMRDGDGMDGELLFKKFGLNFNFTLARTEGNAQALRTLTELATIELFGKLTRIPYWTCLGTTDADPAVQAEIVDWWETMAGDPAALGTYFQTQMRARGLYKGESNGQIDDGLIAALQAYQKALGMPGSSSLDYEFFKRYLAADHSKIQKAAQSAMGPIAAAPEAPAAPPAAPPANTNPPQDGAPANLIVVGTKGRGYVYGKGEKYQVDVTIDRDSKLYCYLVDEDRRVTQFFPSPGTPAALVRGGTRMRFPGTMPFDLSASLKGVTETVTCFAAPAALDDRLLNTPSTVRDADDLGAAFRRVAGGRVPSGRFDVNVQ